MTTETKTKWTPRPWRTTANGNHYQMGSDGLCAKYVCTLAHNVTERRNPDLPGNARLIEKAPEMVEALRHTVTLLDTLYWELAEEAKKRGEPPISRWPELARAERILREVEGE